MEEMLARYMLDLTEIHFESASVREELVASLGKTIQKRFCKPIYPQPGESLALSTMTPKTAALAFDKVHRNPCMNIPVPEEIGFYCATMPEIIYNAFCVFLITAKQVGMASDLVDKYLDPCKKITVQEKIINERESLRLLCSEMWTNLGIVPTIIYHERASMQMEFPVGAHEILKSSISNVAMVDEASLTWDQVIEFRKDLEARKKYRRFVRWADSELRARSPQEVEDIVAKRLDGYEWSIKKHGVKASLGAISCLLDPKFIAGVSAATAATALATNGLWAALTAASLTIGKAVVSFGSEMIDGLDERHKDNYEVAYIYEVQKRLK